MEGIDAFVLCTVHHRIIKNFMKTLARKMLFQKLLHAENLHLGDI